MEQKVIQIGNSAGVVIPRELRKQLGIRIGENIIVDRKGSNIIISNPKKKKSRPVDAKFMKMVEEFIDEHEDVLKELAHR